jgi:hypothetical protein
MDDVIALQQQLKSMQIEQIIGQNATINMANPHGALVQ